MKKIKKAHLYWMTFSFSIIFILGIMFVYHIYPLGKDFFFPGDLASQYMPFIQEFKTLIQDPTQWLYSFHNGLGSSMLSLISYYIASPLNFLLLFLKENQLLGGVLFLIALKLILASLTMSYYLITQKKMQSFSTPLLSICYSFCGFSALYFYNTLWMDVLIWLPLIIAGLERYITENKKGLYQWSLFFLLLSNYYMAWMVCLFIFFYFFYYRMKTTHQSLKEIIMKDYRLFFSFLFHSVLLVLLLSWLYLPTIVSMLSTGKGNFEFQSLIEPLTQTKWYGWVGFGFGMSNYEMRLSHIPSFYFGLLPLALSLTSLFTCHQTRKLDIGFFFLLLACVTLTPLAMVFQLFQETAGFPFRSTYLIVFFLIGILCEGIQDQRLEKRKVQFTLLTMAVFFSGLYLFRDHLDATQPYLAQGLISSVILCGIWFLLCSLSLRSLFFVFIFGSLTEVWGQSVMTLQDIPMVTQKDMQTFCRTYQKALPKENDYLTRIDNTWVDEKKFGLELTGYNNGMWFNYRGTSAYTSTLSTENLQLAKSLGLYSWNERRISYFGSTPLTDTLLAVNHRLVQKGQAITTQRLKNDNGAFVLTKDISLNKKDAITNQNQIATALLQAPVFDTVTIQKQKITDSSNQTEIQAQKGGLLYIELPRIAVSESRQYHVFRNGKEIPLPLEICNTTLIPCGNIRQGEKIQIKIDSKENPHLKEIKFATFNVNRWKQKIESVPKQKVKINHLTLTTSLQGRKKGEIALLSVLYDKDWQATINGKKVIPKESELGLMELPLEKGKNEIILHYVPKLFYLGIILSSFAVVIEGICLYYNKKNKHRD